MMLANIPFPPFEPDRSPFTIQGGRNLLNCVPIKDGWGPFASLQTFTEALPSACLGATYVRTATGAYRIIAGTETGLYELDTTDYSWTDISGSSAPYSVPEGDRWSFCQFGSLLVATNIANPPQSFDVDTGSTFEDLAGSPPQAKYVFNAGDFLVLAHLASFPNRVRWSGINDAEWWTVGQRGADFQDFPDGEEIAGGIPEPLGAIVIQKTAMQYMRFDPNSGYTFTFSPANPARGSNAPLSIVQIGSGDFFYLSESGFFRGVQGVPIGAERVDNWFFQNIDLNEIPGVRGVADPYKKIVWWQFQDLTTARKLIGYNWQLDRWCYSDADVTEMVDLVTPGVTWDGLALLYPSNIDQISVPFDSRLFAGGRPTFGAFNSEGRLGFFTGDNREAVLETGQLELFPFKRAFINGARVETDAQIYTMAVGSVDYHGGDIAYGLEASPSTRSGLVPLRASGRLHSFRLTIPAGEAWQYVTGVRPEGREEGKQ